MRKEFLFLFFLASLPFSQQKFLQIGQVTKPKSFAEVLRRQQKISLVINQTLQHDYFSKPQLMKIKKKNINKQTMSKLKELTSSIESYCPLNSKFRSTSACCSSHHLFNLFNVQFSNGKFIGHSQSFQQIVLPPILSLNFQSPSNFETTVTLSQKPLNCSKFFDGTLHVIGRRTVHKIYHASKSIYPLLIMKISHKDRSFYS
jgi:hypothetical protein